MRVMLEGEKSAVPAYVLRLRKVALVLCGLGVPPALSFFQGLMQGGIALGASIYLLPFVVGTFLYFRPLRAVRYVWTVAALVMSGVVTFVLMTLLLLPSGYISAISADEMYGWTRPVLMLSLVIGGSFGVYRLVRRKDVLEARKEAGLSVRRPYGAFVFGVLLMVLSVTTLFMFNAGKGKAQLSREIVKEYGEGTRFFVRSVHVNVFDERESVAFVIDLFDDKGVERVSARCVGTDHGVGDCVFEPME